MAIDRSMNDQIDNRITVEQKKRKGNRYHLRSVSVLAALKTAKVFECNNNSDGIDASAETAAAAVF